MESILFDFEKFHTSPLNIVLKHLADNESTIRSMDTSFFYSSLQQFNHETHSLWICYILGTRAEKLRNNEKDFFVAIAIEFIEKCDKEIVRNIPKKFLAITRAVSNYFVQERQPKVALKFLFKGLDIIQSRSTLTIVHADILQILLLMKQYHFAAHWIDSSPVFEVQGKLNSMDFLRYFYYAGLVFIGLKRWDDALEVFKLSFSAPASALSLISVEIFRKFILVSLLKNGFVESLPSCTANMTNQRLVSCCSTYMAIGDHFISEDVAKLETFLFSKQDELKEHKNFGLARQLIPELKRKKILKLTHSYVVLSLEDVAKSIGLNNANEAEQLIFQMISDGAISAVIDQFSGSVHFKDIQEIDSMNGFPEKIEQQLQHVMSLTEKIQSFERHIILSPKFIQKLNLPNDENMMQTSTDYNFFNEEFEFES